MRILIATALMLLTSSAIADEQCFAVHQTVFLASGMPLVVLESHCDGDENWYIATDMPGVEGPKRYTQRELFSERDLKR